MLKLLALMFGVFWAILAVRGFVHHRPWYGLAFAALAVAFLFFGMFTLPLDFGTLDPSEPQDSDTEPE